MLELELFNTIDEFLRRTMAWKEQESVFLADGVNEYPIPMPADATLVRVLGVSYDGSPVPSSSSSVVTQSSTGVLVPEMTFPDGDANYLPFKSDLDTGTGIFSYALFKPNYISVNNLPTPAGDMPMLMTVALSVSMGCLDCESCSDWAIPDWMYDMFFQDWLDGVLGRMYAMPSKPWSNLQLAQYHSKRFRNEMAFRKQEAQRGYAYNVPTWRYPQSGWP
jgi:hypothetical protein